MERCYRVPPTEICLLNDKVNVRTASFSSRTYTTPFTRYGPFNFLPTVSPIHYQVSYREQANSHASQKLSRQTGNLAGCGGVRERTKLRRCHSVASINTYNEMGSLEYERGGDLKILSLPAQWC